MLVTVVETPEFQRRARSVMSDGERSELIEFIARNPTAGVSLGGGVRKVRYARDGGGKSGGYRIIHFYNADDGTPVFLITVFAKNEKTSLTASETAMVKELGVALSQNYRRKP